MIKISALIATSALVLGASSVQAQSLYGEVAYQTLDVGLSSDPAIIRGTIGSEINPNVAVEAMLGFGATDGKETISGIPVKLKIDNMWGVFVKPKMKLGDAFEVYGRLGYAGFKATASASAFGYTASESADGSDFAYGVGLTYMVTPKLSISADFMKYDDLDGIALGVGFKF